MLDIVQLERSVKRYSEGKEGVLRILGQGCAIIGLDNLRTKEERNPSQLMEIALRS